ncbi:MAG: HutD family protein [Ilumatobacteraceae bacterium]
MRVVRAAETTRTRWANDGGWTREIAREPADGSPYQWRVSVADVETDGPFSVFAGYDRALVLLSGAGMDLRFTDTGAVTSLRPDEPRARFSGDVPVTATLLDGPTTDFNLIWRRDEWVATARNFDGQQEIGAGGGLDVVVGGYVVSGTATLLNGVTATAGDTFLSEPGERLYLELDGSLVGFLLAPHAAAERGLTGLTVVPKQSG